jgi:hypothetical protein
MLCFFLKWGIDMKIIVLILIFAKISCQEDKAVKLILASSASGVLAGGIYGSIVLLEESANYAVSKIKLSTETQKNYLKKSLVLAGTYGISRALGFTNEGAALIAGTSVVANLIAAQIKNLKNNNYNIEASACAATAGLITTGSIYVTLSQNPVQLQKNRS